LSLITPSSKFSFMGAIITSVILFNLSLDDFLDVQLISYSFLFNLSRNYINYKTLKNIQ